jgi:hypothetical protein
MVRALVILIALLPTLGFAQEYVMYETTYLKVIPGHSQQFNDAMKAHNERFHASGPYRATVWYIGSGSRSGQMFWVMGPTTFTALDNRPSSPEHQSDWADNVLANADAGEVEYWRMDPELSHNVPTGPSPILRARIFDIEFGSEDRFDELQHKLREVDEAKNRNTPVAVFHTVGQSGTGRDTAVVRYYDNWAELDAGGGGSFLSDFEDVHGPGSWARWIRDRNDVVKHVEDEFHELIPELSASESTSND